DQPGLEDHLDLQRSGGGIRRATNDDRGERQERNPERDVRASGTTESGGHGADECPILQAHCETSAAGKFAPWPTCRSDPRSQWRRTFTSRARSGVTSSSLKPSSRRSTSRSPGSAASPRIEAAVTFVFTKPTTRSERGKSGTAPSSICVPARK